MILLDKSSLIIFLLRDFLFTILTNQMQFIAKRMVQGAAWLSQGAAWLSLGCSVA
jgi:hypothetical protein